MSRNLIPEYVVHKMGGRFLHPIRVNGCYLTASFSTHRFASSGLRSRLITCNATVMYDYMLIYRRYYTTPFGFCQP